MRININFSMKNIYIPFFVDECVLGGRSELFLHSMDNLWLITENNNNFILLTHIFFSCFLFFVFLLVTRIWSEEKFFSSFFYLKENGMRNFIESSNGAVFGVLVGLCCVISVVSVMFCWPT